MKTLVFAVFLLFFSFFIVYLSRKKESFRFDVNQIHKKLQNVIRNVGDYNLLPNHTYYFDMSKNNDYLVKNKARDLVNLYLPTQPEDGDTIVLIDKNDRFGWGNLSYDFKLIIGTEEEEIEGDLKDRNLFRFRGGNVILIWNQEKNQWESNGTKGSEQNVWNGWYKLVYKGMRGGADDAVSNTFYPSYMRIDATQHPVLMTIYGGTEMYPINLIVKADIGDLEEEKNTITFLEYPKKLNLTMTQSSPVMKRMRNGIIVDYQYGGGWMKDETIPLNTIPSDLHELN